LYRYVAFALFINSIVEKVLIPIGPALFRLQRLKKVRQLQIFSRPDMLPSADNVPTEEDTDVAAGIIKPPPPYNIPAIGSSMYCRGTALASLSQLLASLTFASLYIERAHSGSSKAEWMYTSLPLAIAGGGGHLLATLIAIDRGDSWQQSCFALWSACWLLIAWYLPLVSYASTIGAGSDASSQSGMTAALLAILVLHVALTITSLGVNKMYPLVCLLSGIGLAALIAAIQDGGESSLATSVSFFIISAVVSIYQWLTELVNGHADEPLLPSGRPVWTLLAAGTQGDRTVRTKVCGMSMAGKIQGIMRTAQIINDGGVVGIPTGNGCVSLLAVVLDAQTNRCLS
jgi:succinate-acetate transporter protein